MRTFFDSAVESRYKTEEELRAITVNYCIALIPVIAAGCYAFGFNAFKVLLASVVSCVASEYIYQKLMKLPVTSLDGTALMTGLLLGLCLPSEVPLYIPILGGMFATIVVVQLFGGYGFHVMNPALVSRCFLLISFSEAMTEYKIDGLTTATPLTIMRNGGTPDLQQLIVFNEQAGCIGEASVLALIVGALFLLIFRKISVITPTVYLFVFTIVICLFGGQDISLNDVLTHIFGGGVIFVAFFFATDRVTSPVGRWGKVIYGVLLGLITAIYRILGTNTESVSYAVIFCNLLVPLIDKYFAPRGVVEKEA
ncbi:MAG: RnfABCDGE type electron transport complex subunit D [Lachnospiraceae bacterium]|nr:RnfABCDGE type electron transport complex subunit D [Lachnospiraceae bacterium]